MHTEEEIKARARVILAHLRVLRTMLTQLDDCSLRRMCRSVPGVCTRHECVVFLLAHVGYVSSRL